MDKLSEGTLVTIFDQLVSEGVIVYGPHESIKVNDGGYPMEFRICPALATKPHTVGATNPAFNYSRKWGPGSDMYCPDERLILTKLNGTHDLALNLFCVDRPQLLILTLDSYRRQHEPLDDTDLTVSLEVLKRFPSMYIIFNCGEQGGCSRVHKHLQGLWGPPYAFNSLTGGFGQNVPFRYFARHLQPGFKDASAVDIASMYSSLLGQSRKILGLSANEACPHNVILWDDWIIVIPRRRGGFGKASANAGGMLGSVWVQSQEQVDEWLQIGCANVLRELGVSPAEVDLLSTKPTAS